LSNDPHLRAVKGVKRENLQRKVKRKEKERVSA
jgi:hypothetical protein